MRRGEFIRATSAFGLLIPWHEITQAVFFSDDGYEEKIKERSIAAFKRFEAVWDFNDFWKRGNTFDACLNFAGALHRKWPADAGVIAIQKRIGEMLEVNLNYFASFDPGGLWADDFGWWGLMALNANRHLLRLNNTTLANKYIDLCIQCWRQKKNHAFDSTDTAKPVPRGCRNGDANGKDKGVKNTVTNVLMFLLSTRIYREIIGDYASNKDDYLEMAYSQWTWFDSWFKLQEYGYLKKLTGGGALVQERPMAVFEGSDYRDTTHPTWKEGWMWTGDQGMLLAALADLLGTRNELATWISKKKIDRSFSLSVFGKTVNSYISLVSRGIRSGLVAESDGVIREAPSLGNFGPAFGNDYLAGRGIMMRYLGRLKGNIGGIDLSKNIRATADAIWQTRDVATNQFQPEFTSPENDRSYVAQFRKLAGIADEVHKWSISAMNEKQKFGVCQSIGMDALGACINTMQG